MDEKQFKKIMEKLDKILVLKIIEGKERDEQKEMNRKRS